MNRGRKVLIGLGLIAFVTAAGKLTWDQAFPSASYRIRMTVEVETPQGLRSGSGVIEIRASKAFEGPFTESVSQRWSLIGDAVPVAISTDRTLFVLASDNITGELAEIYTRELSKSLSIEGDKLTAAIMLDRASSIGASASLQQENFPKLIYFTDPDDPKTIQVVTKDELSDKFGVGVRIKVISLELTDEAITTGIETRLPSYGNETKFSEWYRDLNYYDSRRISKDQLSAGDET